MNSNTEKARRRANRFALFTAVGLVVSFIFASVRVVVLVYFGLAAAFALAVAALILSHIANELEGL